MNLVTMLLGYEVKTLIKITIKMWLFFETIDKNEMLPIVKA